MRGLVGLAVSQVPWYTYDPLHLVRLPAELSVPLPALLTHLQVVRCDQTQPMPPDLTAALV